MPNPFIGSINAAGGTIVDLFDAPFNTALIEFSGVFAGVTITAELTQDAGVNWAQTAMIRQSDYNVFGLPPNAYPASVVAASSAVVFRIPLLSMSNGLRITANAITSGTLNVRVLKGSFDQGSIVMIPVGPAMNNTLLELTRLRVAASMNDGNDYSQAVALTDLGNV